MPLLADLDAIEAWSAERVRPSALQRREGEGTEALVRQALREGMSDWLLVDDKPAWTRFLPRMAALTRGAGDLGFGMAIMVQNLVTGLHLGLNAKHAGAAEVLAAARRGEKIVSFAVTEPDVGAHPGKLKSTAVLEAGQWHLTGSKIYSTNGFWADEVVLVAVSGEENGKKRFVAVVVPANAPGFTRQEICLPVCPTSTHAAFQFDVRAPQDRQVGDEGTAYLRIVKPFRAYEDLAGAAIFLGHLQGMERDAAHMPAEVRGRFRAVLAGLNALMMSAGHALDEGGRHDALRLSLPYLLDAAVKIVSEHTSDDPLWQARVADVGIVTLGGNVRKRFYEQLGA